MKMNSNQNSSLKTRTEEFSEVEKHLNLCRVKAVSSYIQSYLSRQSDIDEYLEIRPPEETEPLTLDLITNQAGFTPEGLEIYEQLNPTFYSCTDLLDDQGFLDRQDFLRSLEKSDPEAALAFQDLLKSIEAGDSSKANLCSGGLLKFVMESNLGAVRNYFIRAGGVLGRRLESLDNDPNQFAILEYGWKGASVHFAKQKALCLIFNQILDDQDKQEVVQSLESFMKDNQTEVQKILEFQPRPDREAILSKLYALLCIGKLNIGIDELSRHYDRFFINREESILGNPYSNYIRLSRALLENRRDRLQQLAQSANAVELRAKKKHQQGDDWKPDVEEYVRLEADWEGLKTSIRLIAKDRGEVLRVREHFDYSPNSS